MDAGSYTPERVESPVTARHGGRSLALAVLCTLLFLTFLDNTIVSVALGDVQTTLHAGVTQLQWVVGAYALVFASAMLACGMIGDEFGRKTVMMAGASVFCAGSVVCALAPDPGVLIAGRAIMGLGAAASEPGTLSMLRQIYTEQRSRDRAIGVWAGVSGLALAFGPVIGGALVGAWNWRAIFWFNLAFGLAALIAAAVILPENSDPEAHRVDTGGTLAGAACLATLVFAVISGETAGYGATDVIALFCASAVCAAAFVWWERRTPHPVLNLRFLRAARFSTANVVAFCTYFGTFAVFFFTALYLYEVSAYSGYQIALVFLPLTVLMIAASVLIGRYLGALGLRWSIFGGCTLFAVGLYLTDISLQQHPSFAELTLSLALTGIGIGATVVPITSAALDAVPAERSGMAASMTNTSREIGAVIGAAVLGALVIGQLNVVLTAKLRALGLPAFVKTIVIEGIETGKLTSANAQAQGQNPKLVQEVINVAYSAVHTAISASLLLSAGLVFAAGLLALVTLRSRRTSRSG
ncbi:MAG TPA: MFS transporter [Streptosporangiaceae bacterium]|nr:MFS transporter [Streptosporangiaceae bacterium]